MTANQQEQLGTTLWAMADSLRGAMNADGHPHPRAGSPDHTPPIQ